MMNNYFTSYKALDPPPIISDSEKMVFSNIEEWSKPIEYEESQIQTPKYQSKFQFDNPTESHYEITDLTADTSLLHSKNNNVVDYARQFVGKLPYIWGGTNPNKGFDCSGLVQYAYKQVGIKLPRTANEMAKVGKEVDIDKVQPGDIIVTRSGASKSGYHVVMVSANTDNGIQIISATGVNKGIEEKIFNNYDNIIAVRRITDNYTPSITNKSEYITTMSKYISQALLNIGEDPDVWTPILVAHTAMESEWGNDWSKKHNNYAGIKGNGTKVNNVEYEGNKKTTKKSSFRHFDSIKDFCTYYVKLLRDRYNVFEDSPENFINNLKSKGYFTAPLSIYNNNFKSVLKRVIA